MANLREEVPVEFADDERWYKYFTTKSLIVAVAGIVLTLLLAKLFSIFHLTFVGVIIGAVIGVGAFFITVFKWPINDTLNGAGCTLATIIFRVLCHKKSKRIYVKMYHQKGDTDA